MLATHHKKLDNVKWLLAAICPWDEQAYAVAFSNNNRGIFTWFCPGLLEKYFDDDWPSLFSV
jgi:hypothetical protein